MNQWISFSLACAVLLISLMAVAQERGVLGVSVPCEIFAKVANAKKVKMRLGDRNFDLGKEHLGPLRDLAGRAGC